MEEKDIDPKTIRTYESDIANAIQHHQTSQADMVVAAEEKKHEQEQQSNVLVVHADTEPKDKIKWVKNTIMILLSLILLGGGAYIAYYFYITSPLTVKQPSTPAPAPSIVVSSIITPDLQKILDITGQTSAQISAQTEKLSLQNTLQDGGIFEIVLAKQASSTQNGKTTSVLSRITGPQFISTLGLNPPQGLTSSLTNQLMFGFYSSTTGVNGTTTTPFVILTNNFFQNAFAGMLSWEPTMASDFSGLFGVQPTKMLENL